MFKHATTALILASAFAFGAATTVGCGPNCPATISPAPAPSAGPATPAAAGDGLTGKSAADAMFEQWRRAHPDANWEQDVREQHGLKPAADNSKLIGSSQGATYGEVTERDILTWKQESERLALAGSRIFHSAQELGSTNDVSCDMCHPHASNTHPETYPKYQVQLGRVVLLRDMINWCIEQPVRGKKLEPDSPQMRALEAYILAQRSGVKLEYGKR